MGKYRDYDVEKIKDEFYVKQDEMDTILNRIEDDVNDILNSDLNNVIRKLENLSNALY